MSANIYYQTESLVLGNNSWNYLTIRKQMSSDSFKN